MAYCHNLRSSDRVFKVEDQVIVLIPDSTNKLLKSWQGPSIVVQKCNLHSFLVKMPDNSTKHIHQNKLRHYIASSNSVNVLFEEEKEFVMLKLHQMLPKNLNSSKSSITSKLII
ncbi:uncharacterized protein NPIL_675341 [Nephila pilipes]|uniref:Uncharacterized protein n=1 Tax=Nephila pilipes TaxID=299642 RepID=A0A8X6P525_NEPPI|nr:uncharacterized protein NPIL_675341 [Nephila pilipes]